MGILTRFKDIMASNINAMLDKAEDPEKMIDQFLRNLESDLGKVKAETASVIADEKAAERELNECNEEIAKMEKYAEKAILAENDGEARQFLTKKSELTTKLETLQSKYDAAHENAEKMRQMHDKLESDVAELKSRKDALKAKMAVAKTQEKINKIGSSIDGANSSIEAFDRLEAKANKKLDEAEAMAELNASSKKDSIAELAKKYDSAPDTSVDDELAALKAKMGK